MNTLTPQQVEIIDLIGFKIERVTELYGDKDFKDGGRWFRNWNLTYVLYFFDTLNFLMREESTDDWTMFNKPLVERSDSDTLLNICGACHFQSLSFTLYQQMMAGNPVNYSAMIGWLEAIYLPPDSYPVAWFNLLKRRAGLKEYGLAATALLYARIGELLDVDSTETENADCWGGLSTMTSMCMVDSLKDEKWIAYIDKWFS